jgi:hypothetical protein
MKPALFFGELLNLCIDNINFFDWIFLLENYLSLNLVRDANGHNVFVVNRLDDPSVSGFAYCVCGGLISAIEDFLLWSISRSAKFSDFFAREISVH